MARHIDIRDFLTHHFQPKQENALAFPDALIDAITHDLEQLGIFHIVEEASDSGKRTAGAYRLVRSIENGQVLKMPTIGYAKSWEQYARHQKSGEHKTAPHMDDIIVPPLTKRRYHFEGPPEIDTYIEIFPTLTTAPELKKQLDRHFSRLSVAEQEVYTARLATLPLFPNIELVRNYKVTSHMLGCSLEIARQCLAQLGHKVTDLNENNVGFLVLTKQEARNADIPPDRLLPLDRDNVVIAWQGVPVSYVIDAGELKDRRAKSIVKSPNDAKPYSFTFDYDIDAVYQPGLLTRILPQLASQGMDADSHLIVSQDRATFRGLGQP